METEDQLNYRQDNIGTKLQLKTWLENAIKKAQMPSNREKILKLRKQKVLKIQKNYGL